MKNALLVKITKIFVDPHGSPDEGGVYKFVTKDEKYLNLNDKYTFVDEPEEIIPFEDLEGSPDGYNSEYDYYEVKKISDEKYVEYKKITETYNKL